MDSRTHKKENYFKGWTIRFLMGHSTNFQLLDIYVYSSFPAGFFGGAMFFYGILKQKFRMSCFY